VIDLVQMKSIIWDNEDLGATFVVGDIPADMVEKANEYRSVLVEQAVEMDEEVMMAYLEGEEPDEATLKRLIRKGTIEGVFVPVVTGTVRASPIARAPSPPPGSALPGRLQCSPLALTSYVCYATLPNN
jgi:translation elongation factor EF-G